MLAIGHGVLENILREGWNHDGLHQVMQANPLSQRGFGCATKIVRLSFVLSNSKSLYRQGHMKPQLEKSGTIGAVLAAILCPVCFPKLAVIGAILGLGTLAPLEGWFAAAAQGFLVLAFIGHLLALRRHHVVWITLLAGLSLLLIFGSLWIHYIEALVYLGLAAMVAATIWSMVALRKASRKNHA